MANNIQLANGIELSRRDKEYQEQRLLSYVRQCAERRTVKTQDRK